MAEPYDPLFKLRYGVDSGEKYRQAVTGATPGALPIHSEDDLAREERRTAGNLFAREHPSFAPIVQPSVDALRNSLFGDDPKVTAAAQEGQNAALGPPDAATQRSASRVKGAFKVAASLTMGGLPTVALESWDNAAKHFFGRK